MWQRVQPALWHPMATLEQSLMDLDKATAGMLSAPFRLTQAMMPRFLGQHDADAFFRDLVSSDREASPSSSKKHKHQRHKHEKTDDIPENSSSFATYSYSSSTVVDDAGRRITSVRRRYEDSLGRLKAEHERELDGRSLKTIWRREHRDDEGTHETVSSDGSPAEAFEEAWSQTPFGQADSKKSSNVATKPQGLDMDAHKPKSVLETERQSEDVTPGPDYEAAKRAPEKECGKEADGVTKEAHERSRDEAIARGSKNQEEETTPPDYS
ncbi:hypothetical protein PINS_up010829 [Pythium insidiosum]|nr:hypothetical protein PINS_up010829 [Pythium insidiosum]